MNLDSLSVLVVGAGIGGLAAAAALGRAGARVTIAEKAESVRAIGAGIVLQPNALAALAHCGAAVEGEPMTEAVILDAAGRTLQAADLSGIIQRFGPSLAVHRGDLSAALQRAADGIPLWTGAAPQSLEAAPDGVRVRFPDQEARFDLVIAADGLRSGVRGLLYGEHPGDVAYSGYTCWRAVVRAPVTAGTCEMWGRGARVGIVRLRDGLAYTFLVKNAPPRSAPRSADQIRSDFAAFQGGAPAVLAALTDADLLHHDIEEVGAIRWGTPQVWLLGDAAHAMTPNLGQGAGLALEDAATALEALRGGADLAAAHAAYVGARDPRARRLKRASAWFGWLSQWENAPARAARDLLLRATPASAGEGALADIVSWRPTALVPR